MIHLDTELFYWINHHYCTMLDWILWGASQHWSWAIVLLFFFSFGTLRYEPKKWWIVLTGIVFCFLLSDRISVVCFKDVFCRPRPCHALENVRMFNTSCGGMYGFVSSHAANIGALATFLILRLRKASTVFRKANRMEKPKWALSYTSYSILMGLWMITVCYSRPYLGKHYPGDVICGAILGIVLGIAIFYSIYLIENRNIAIKTRKK